MTADRIPSRTILALMRYKDTGTKPGDFLQAVLRNDFCTAVCRADKENSECLVAIAQWVYNELPGPAWGSEKKVNTWMRHQGVNGWRKAEGSGS